MAPLNAEERVEGVEPAEPAAAVDGRANLSVVIAGETEAEAEAPVEEEAQQPEAGAVVVEVATAKGTAAVEEITGDGEFQLPNGVLGGWWSVPVLRYDLAHVDGAGIGGMIWCVWASLVLAG